MGPSLLLQLAAFVLPAFDTRPHVAQQDRATVYEAVRCRFESCRGDDHHQQQGSSEMEQISKRLMNWASILEDTTRAQAVTTSLMPFIHPHVALMPDAHLGKGATVGSVIPTVGAIIPAAVGVDIGC